MFDTIEQARLSELHVKSNEDTQLRAIIAIHNTHLGPALGGCRCIEYPNDDHAILDAIRLAKGMSYKAALAQIPQGGGKAVLIKPKVLKDRKAYFESFGEFVDTLGGRYITAVDCGTSTDDMEFVAHKTQWVSGTLANGGDPSPITALGVFEGIKTCIRFKTQQDHLSNIHVAIQGVGNVGYHLAKLLFESGARLSVTDLDTKKLERCADEFSATVLPPDQIYHAPCDVFAPCSLGAILNESSISQLRCSIVAGAANNQLAKESHGEQLHRQNILYAPDYVINAGGLIHVSLSRSNISKETIIEKTHHIGDTLYQVLQRAAKENRPPGLIANKMAEEILYMSH